MHAQKRILNKINYKMNILKKLIEEIGVKKDNDKSFYRKLVIDVNYLEELKKTMVLYKDD